ncbi:MAG: ZIP family metal transporter [Bacillota bacterium]
MAEIAITSTLAGLATVLGALIVIMFGKPRAPVLSLLLGLAAGVMIGVVIMDLLPSALVYGDLKITILGSIAGVVMMFALQRAIVHSSSFERVRTAKHWLSMGYFIALAIAMHDFPEGLAIGAGYFAEPGLGVMIALAIGLHNIQEGIGMAAPLWMGGASIPRILMITLLTSLCTPLGALTGTLFFGLSSAIIGLAIALAAGAMIYVVVSELLPQAQELGIVTGAVGIALGLGLVVLAL